MSSIRFSGEKPPKKTEEQALRDFLEKVTPNPKIALHKKMEIDAVLYSTFKSLMEVLRGLDETSKEILITWYTYGPGPADSADALQTYLQKVSSNYKRDLVLKSQIDTIVLQAEHKIHTILNTLDPTAQVGVRTYFTNKGA